MSYQFKLGHTSGPMIMKAACAGCGNFPQDDNGDMGIDQGLPALKPNVAIIIIGLGFTLVLVAAFAVFAKFMRPHMSRQDSSSSSRLWEDVVKDGNSVDTNMIKSLPLVVYSTESFQGLNLDLECAVCLSQFEEEEELRLLPNCKHMFHPACIDSWLRSHPSCPLCRSNIVSPSCNWALRSPPRNAALNSIHVAPIPEELDRASDSDQQQPSSHAVEITVLECFEARLDALRDSSCCGRKHTRRFANAAGESMQREGNNAIVIDLQRTHGVHSMPIVASTLGRGDNLVVHELRDPIEKRSHIVPEAESGEAPEESGWVPRPLRTDTRRMEEASSSTTPSAVEYTSHDR